MRNPLQKLLMLLCLFVYSNTFSQTLKYHRITAKMTPAQLEHVMHSGMEVDHFEYTPEKGFSAEVSDVDIRVLKANNIKINYVIKDLEKNIVSYNKKIDRLAARNASRNPTATLGNIAARSTATPTNFTLGSMGGFYTFAEMETVLNSMRTKFPNLVSVKSNIGNSVQGRAIWMVKISDNPDVDESEPRTCLNGLHHAREPISISQLIHFMWYILENYNTDKEIKSLINSSEIYFVPCINPDGYVYNQTTNPSGGGNWRKNRKLNSGGSYGIDLNRNYSYKWGFDNVGSSPTQSSDTYRGTAAFSEPEIQVMRNFYNSKNVKTGINYHSYGNKCLHPNAFEAAVNTNPELSFFTTIGNYLTTENGFQVGNTYSTLQYTANGNAVDWMYFEQTTKIKAYNFTIEVGSASDGFWPASSRITPICNSNVDINLNMLRISTYHGLATQNGATTFSTPTSGALNFSFKNFSITPTSYTVSLTPITSGVTSSIAPKTISGLAMLATQQNAFTFTIDPASPSNKVFQFALTVNNGLSTITDTVSVTYVFTDTQAPTAPTSLTASGTTQTTTNLSWTASTDNIAVTGYEVYRGATLLSTVATTSYAVTGLTASTAYAFTVKAKDAAGNLSAASNTANVTTLTPPDTQAPSAPTNLTASGTTQSATNLSWTASTDNIGVTGYDVYQGATLLATVATTSFAVSGLAASTAYTFTVKAKDAAGNLSAASNTANVTTLDTQAPTTPTNLTATGTTQSSTNLSWTGSTDNVGVTGYNVYQGAALIATVATTSYTVSGLAASTAYAFTVKAKDAAGNLSSSSNTANITTPDTQAPSSPTNLTASGTTQTTTNLTWTGSTDNVAVTGYNVYQGATLLATVATTSYAVSGLSSSTAYTFTVKAIDAAGNLSSASNAANVTTPAPPDTQAPSIPANLTASGTTETTTNLTWTASTDNIGVTGYDVYQGASLLATVATTNYAVTGLSASTAYTFTVKAKDAAGNISGASNAANITTVTPPDTQSPSIPSNLTATGTTTTSTFLSWSASSDNIGVTGYDVYQGASLIATVATTSYSVTGLLASTGYSFTVKAKDAAGNISGASNVENVTTLTPPDTQSPSAPLNLISTGTTYSSTQLSWDASSDNVGVIGYNIFQEGVLIGSSVTTNFSVTGLNELSSYTFTVKAKDAAGNISSESNALNVTTPAQPDTQAPDAPANLTASGTTSTSTNLTWDASTDNIGVTGYNVYGGVSLIGTVTTLNYTVNGLNQSTGYSFTIRAIDAAGNESAASNIATVTTLTLPDIEIPTAPGNLTESATTSNSTLLSWDASTDNVGVIAYDIYLGEDYIGTSATTNFTVTGLSENTTYSFFVVALDAAGNSSITSNVLFVTTLIFTDTEVPSSPSGLVASGTTQTTTNLSWTASTDNIGVTGYNVYQGATLLATVSTLNYSVSGLSASTNYSFSVKAIDAAGNESGSSNIVSVTTLTAPDTQAPSAPANLTASGTTQTSTVLNWSASSDNIGVTGYHVYRDATLIATVTTLTYTATGLTANTAYTFYVTAKDAAGNVSGSSNVTNVTTLPAVITYCTSKGSNVTYEYINKVQVGTINNTSGANAGYGNYTGLSTNLVKGVASSITITPAFPRTTKYSEAYSVWIDYNRDGDFTDAGEQVYTRAATTTSPIVGSFTVPAATTTGPTRMRVSMKYSAIPTSCESFTYGEVEDYTVNISLVAAKNNIMQPAVETTINKNEPLSLHDDTEMSVSPNPVSGPFINIKSVANGARYRIINMSMQTVLTGTLRNSTIDVSQLNTGNYFIEVINNNNKTTTQFFRTK